MRRVIIICIMFLILLPVTKGKAKDIPDDFGERIENMIREHKLMTQRLIKYMEHQREEITLLAEVIYHENWHTDKDKRAAYLTGAVVMNRVNRDDSWLHLKGEKTVYDVVYARGQYSTTHLFYTKEIPQECYDMARDIYKNGTPDVPADVIFQATFKQGPKYDLINGEWFCFG